MLLRDDGDPEFRPYITLAGHAAGVSSVAFSPDGKTLATGGDYVQLWDVARGRSTATLTGHTNAAYTADVQPRREDSRLGGEDNTARLWDVTTGRNTATFTGHTKFALEAQRNVISSVAFDRDGKTLATGGTDHAVRLWDVATGHTTAALTPRPHTEWVHSVAFSPDGTSLAAGGDDPTPPDCGGLRRWRDGDHAEG